MAVVRDIIPPIGHLVETQRAPASATSVAPTVQSPSAPSALLAAPLPAPVVSVAASPPENIEEVTRRRTARSTAGQHSNRHHLPRSANEVAQAWPSVAQANAILAFFRPWS